MVGLAIVVCNTEGARIAAFEASPTGFVLRGIKVTVTCKPAENSFWLRVLLGVVCNIFGDIWEGMDRALEISGFGELR